MRQQELFLPSFSRRHQNLSLFFFCILMLALNVTPATPHSCPHLHILVYFTSEESRIARRTLFVYLLAPLRFGFMPGRSTMDNVTQPSSPVAVNEGAEDVVEADLAASDAHHAHLVEGDFFPTEVPLVENDVSGSPTGAAAEEEEGNVDEIAAEAAAAAAASAPSTPSKPTTPPSRKRVRWADDDGSGGTPRSHGLVKHVTSFYMPHSSRAAWMDTGDPSSPARPSHAAATVNPAPSVFRDKVNADGSAYKFCKAQRPAPRFAEWKRQPHEYGASPFESQACGAGSSGLPTMPRTEAPPIPVHTLFGVLFQRSVVTRVAEGHVRFRTGTHHSGHADTSLQLPFVRVDELFDEPVPIPLQP